MNDFKKIRIESGMSRTEFAEHFEIPYRTVQNWELGLRECPDYLLKLIEFKLNKEDLIRNDMTKESGIYVIFRDSQDDYCDIKGFIRGTEEEAEEYCNAFNENCKHYWEEIEWEKIEVLNK